MMGTGAYAGVSRRTFGKLAASGLAATAIPWPLESKLEIGIGTYSYHNLTLEAMIVQLSSLKISEIEMSRGEFMLMNHPDDDMFRAARRTLDAARVQSVSYYSATIRNDQDLENAVRFAKILGARNISGDATGGILSRIDKRCSQEDLTFGIHNHFFKGGKFAYESPEDVLQALAGLSHAVGATADIGHFASCGHDPVDAVRRLGPRLKLVHLKDVEAAGGEINVLLGKGIAKVPEVMRELHKQNFPELIAIEYEKEGNVNADIETDVEIARALA